MEVAYKRFTLARDVETIEALGQLGGSGDLRADIDLCRLQTIEPFFLKYLPKPGRILEAGCGRGRWVFYLRNKGYDVIGIDIARSDVRAARDFDPTVPVSEGDMLKTSFPDAHFEAVISLGVVEHFEGGPAAALAEVSRILTQGGLFFVTVPTQNLVRRILFNHIKNVQLRLMELRGHKLAFEEFRYTRQQFEAHLRSAGFMPVECVPDDFIPPKNMGLYTDSRYLRSHGSVWELNSLGRSLNAVLLKLSPWLHCSGTLWVTRKQESAFSG